MSEMKAARISPSPSGTPPYSASNPAPSTAITFSTLPIPTPSQPGELVVNIKATTVIRDNLTWPELYDASSPAHLGNDFSGIVTAVNADAPYFRPGDAVFGMADAHRGGTWAEYAVVKTREIAMKPVDMDFETAAALPLSALTADQALFEHGWLSPKVEEVEGASRSQRERVLVTGASGGVGRFLVEFAARAGHEVVAASSSSARNAGYLRRLGAGEVVEYGDLGGVGPVDVVVDTVGGKVLERCWDVIKPSGRLVSIDSADMDWVRTHHKKGLDKGKERVRAVFFIVAPSRKSLVRIAETVGHGTREGLVAKVLPFEQAREAYDLAHSGNVGRGKVVLKL